MIVRVAASEQSKNSGRFFGAHLAPVRDGAIKSSAYVDKKLGARRQIYADSERERYPRARQKRNKKTETTLRINLLRDLHFADSLQIAQVVRRLNLRSLFALSLRTAVGGSSEVLFEPVIGDINPLRCRGAAEQPLAFAARPCPNHG